MSNDQRFGLSNGDGRAPYDKGRRDDGESNPPHDGPRVPGRDGSALRRSGAHIADPIQQALDAFDAGRDASVVRDDQVRFADAVYDDIARIRAGAEEFP